MRRLKTLSILPLAVATTGFACLHVATPPYVYASSAASATPDGPDIDPDAMAALDKMGAYLRTLKAFQVQASATAEDVLENGQKIQYQTATNMLAETPRRLRVEVTGDRQHRLYLYDGKNVTVWAARVNYYATVPAPPTIAELTNVLYEKYDIEMPLEDLFFWGSKWATTDKIKGAMDVGPSDVEGTTCEQYAFRQEGLDWQVWIQKGDFPLPRKIVITTLTDEARPQHTSVLTWNLAPSFNEATFTFDPPSDAHKIVLAEVGASGGQKQ